MGRDSLLVLRRTLVGREREREALDRLLDGARAESSGVLVMHGEAGVGKTALLEYGVETGTDFRIARTLGVEAEMELPFAAVQQLCSSFLAFKDRLPKPQHDALDVAFGLRTGPPPDQFLAGLAVLGLLAEAAEKQPLICVVDDSQWLDRTSALILAFVARRLVAERIALLFATRELGPTFSGLPELHVRPLKPRHARALLESVLPAPLDEHVLERIVEETRGNPLALMELPRGLSPTQLAGGFGLPATAPVSDGIEHRFADRLMELPSDARRLLLVAAADPVGDPTLVWRAAELLEIPESAAAAVEAEQLLVLSPRVVFRHPLVRSAAYRSAGPNERREVHRALAQATDPRIDPDRRAWHLAHAASKPDEDVAAELERCAARAQSRGGLAAAAAFLERAAMLSPEPARRAQRALIAAETKFQAGAFDQALDLLEIAESTTAVDQALTARAHLLRAQVRFASRRVSDAPPLLLAAARELANVDPSLARATYLEALSAAAFAGRLAKGPGVFEISKFALAGPAPPEKPQPSDLLLQALAVQATEGYAAGAPLVKAALRAFQYEANLSANDARWLWLACMVALFAWDDQAWTVLFRRQLDLARQSGALSPLAFALGAGIGVYAFFGELQGAVLLQEELRAVTEATGIAPDPAASLSLAALRGSESEFAHLITTTIREAESRGEGIALSNAEFLSGCLYNGLGRYDAALAAVVPAERYRKEGSVIWALTELVEAAVRSGQPERAQHALERVQETTSAAGTDWALGIEARLRALLSDSHDADELYREAISRLSRTRIRVQLARTQLLYGEWLRRKRRRLDAREQLRTAYEFFRDAGLVGFAERARLELEATGERVHKRSEGTLNELTPQELQVGRLAAEGKANREIAAQMFISINTVDYHLRKVFRKLGVRSRTELARRLS